MRLDRADPRPPYLQIADALRQAIREGRYKPGDRLPSARELAASYGVVQGTVRSAMDVLRREKLITSWQGKGVIVRDPSAPAAGRSPEFRAVMNALEQLAERVEDLEARADEGGLPPARNAPQPRRGGAAAG